MLASTITPLCHFRCVIINAFVECAQYPLFRTQFLDCSECANSTIHSHILLSLNAVYTLMHSKYLVQDAIWDTSVLTYGANAFDYGYNSKLCVLLFM